ncbi:DNA repair protein UVH3 [Apostasia shenzhenica]|uniref:DNA repair protein UVH3 n=1 Tax=Apostasia shenzhenica TaxID=1088818 RepID=A0A2I0AH05_9ASPA|nr:DNA repair protein UVH3 [Apostasia shenzhenica]
MGVQGLWELLAPVGRRVSVETLSGKKLAIDASIWMIQFMKAMRDERGEMVRNAHVLGFFRRICKLLFLRTKPVFVFDGGTPALKRRTAAARRRHRENARAKIRKTAEKLLINHVRFLFRFSSRLFHLNLKSKRLEELAEEIKRNTSVIGNDSTEKRVAAVGDGGAHAVKVSSSDQSHEAGDRAMNQESLDEMLAASIAAEEEGMLATNENVLSGDLRYTEEGEEDEDEQMIFPLNSGNIDPAVLASLPPSMQLDLLVQMRENLMAENRQKYQTIKKMPGKFSELQIQSYLKTVAFRREIDEVQKCAAGRGVGGLQTSRIASEANREFIFSSSFSGDKQILTSRDPGKNHVVNQERNTKTFLNASKGKLFMSESTSAAKVLADKFTTNAGHNVETYLDDTGRVRVSRVRGLGIRMTRDLQRNLDLMKEYEQVFGMTDTSKSPSQILHNDVSVISATGPALGTVEENLCTSSSLANEATSDGIIRNSGTPSTISSSKAVIEVSFTEDGSGLNDTDRNVFMNLASENQASQLMPESSCLEENLDDTDMWEDGVVGEQNSNLYYQPDKLNKTLVMESNRCEEDEIEWEQVASFASPSLAKNGNAISRGLLEEEADLQEAIRRSLEDIELKCTSSVAHVNTYAAVSSEDKNFSKSYKSGYKVELAIDRSTLQGAAQDPFRREVECSVGTDIHKFVNSRNEHPSSCIILEELPDAKSTPRGDDDGSAFVTSNLGLSHSIDSSEQIQKQSLPENSFHANCLLEQNAKIKLEGTAGRLDTCPSDAYKDYVAFQSKYSSEVVSSEIAPSSSSRCGMVISQEIFATENASVGKDTQKVVEIGIDNNPVEMPLSFDQTSNQVLDNVVVLEANLNDEVPFPTKEHKIIRPSMVVSREITTTKKAETTKDEMQNVVEIGIDNNPTEMPILFEQTSKQELENVCVLEANLDDEISFLRKERENIREEQRKLERNAESVSNEMFAECQELLQMFGLPYIIAPMEAEAQCAYMEIANLVDGVVTDDSDVFLFGARNVYKNIFDDRKYVETYFMKDIEDELSLSREKLVRMALLLGSDYTEGVSGIGIVNAIEVVNAFPEEDGLLKFKEWVESPDPAILELHGSSSGSKLKRPSTTRRNTEEGIKDNIDSSASMEHDLGGAVDPSSVKAQFDTKKEVFMEKHRNVSKNWHFPTPFPSDSVIAAYISPQVDESTEPFSWGKPDLPLLRQMCWEKFGWPNQKADALLVPVLKEYNKHETQLRLEAFYSFNERFAKIRSQRIKKAIKGITGTCSDIAGEFSSRGKRKISPCDNDVHQPENDAHRSTNIEGISSKQRMGAEPQTQLTHGSAQSSEQDGGGRRGRDERVNARARGRGQGRHRARGRGRSKGRGNEQPNDKSEESSSDDERRIMSEMDLPARKPESALEMRRSTRRRKQVDYTEDDPEINELQNPDKASDRAASNHAEVGGSNFDKNNMISHGSFCADESETENDKLVLPDYSIQHSLEQYDAENQWQSEEINPKGYLATGGGFCMDEGDIDLQAESGGLKQKIIDDKDHDKAQVSDPKKYSVRVDEQSVPEGPDSGLEQAKVSDGSAKILLSAMPSLKRKRKG